MFSSRTRLCVEELYKKRVINGCLFALFRNQLTRKKGFPAIFLRVSYQKKVGQQSTQNVSAYEKHLEAKLVGLWSGESTLTVESIVRRKPVKPLSGIRSSSKPASLNPLLVFEGWGIRKAQALGYSRQAGTKGAVRPNGRKDSKRSWKDSQTHIDREDLAQARVVGQVFSKVDMIHSNAISERNELCSLNL